MNKDPKQDLEYQDFGINGDRPTEQKKSMSLDDENLSTLSVVIRFLKLGVPSIIAVFFMMIVGTTN